MSKIPKLNFFMVAILSQIVHVLKKKVKNAIKYEYNFMHNIEIIKKKTYFTKSINMQTSLAQLNIKNFLTVDNNLHSLVRINIV